MVTLLLRLHIAAWLLVLVVSPPLFASGIGIPAGSITGGFSNPVLMGSNVDPGLNMIVPQNNSLTAVSTGFDAASPNNITWGANPSFSRLMFVPENFPAQPPGAEFLLGRFLFTNGESAGTTLIFGMTFRMSVSLANVDPYTSSVLIASPVNDAVANTPGCLLGRTVEQCNSDFVEIVLLNSHDPIHPQDLSLNVLEGQMGSFDLRGTVAGDPFLDLTRVTVTPGFESVAFIGHGLADFPTASAPEPASLVLLGTGLVSLAVRRRHRRQSGVLERPSQRRR